MKNSSFKALESAEEWLEDSDVGVVIPREGEPTDREIEEIADKVLVQWDAEVAERRRKSYRLVAAAAVTAAVSLYMGGALSAVDERGGSLSYISEMSLMPIGQASRAKGRQPHTKQSASAPRESSELAKRSPPSKGGTSPRNVSISYLMRKSIYTPNPGDAELASTRAALAVRKPCTSRVSFCVNSRGSTEDIKSTSHCYDTKVDRISREAVALWKFEPLVRKVCTHMEFSFEFG